MTASKSQKFGWETAMALLFIGAKHHRIKESELDSRKEEFACFNTETSQEALSSCRSRKHASSTQSEDRHGRYDGSTGICLLAASGR
jgi:hypothetical protein